MKEKMETAQLHIITLNNNEIQWAKSGKEIWVDGKMFDIKSFESKNGVTIFKGLFDDEETLLKQNLKKSNEQNQENQNQLITQLFQTLHSIYHAYSVDTYTELNKQLHNNTFISPGIHSQFLEIPTPPPLV